MKPFKTIKYRGHKIHLITDESPESPREWDNIGEILYTSSRYVLGDRRTTREEIENITQREDTIYLPVYAYIHSSTALATTPFHCPWDSGQCGIIWCTKERALRECTSIEKAKKYLHREIETFSQYLQGQVIGYDIEGPYSQDSCWGFYPGENGGYDYVIQEAKSSVDYAIEVARERRNAKVLELRLAREQVYALI